MDKQKSGNKFLQLDIGSAESGTAALFLLPLTFPDKYKRFYTCRIQDDGIAPRQTATKLFSLSMRRVIQTSASFCLTKVLHTVAVIVRP